ncbi:hypothetical protein CEXT_196521 [Caerostris extrusa]|uniref:Uncharacterized protein n=1 Tax=Caerostris extrusa TaxID=172846 RepID=A0AAV4RZ08_CAEEX|nr:hypothetical protein CEXT_196521 [Caerostris extrusa]
MGPCKDSPKELQLGAMEMGETWAFLSVSVSHREVSGGVANIWLTFPPKRKDQGMTNGRLGAKKKHSILTDPDSLLLSHSQQVKPKLNRCEKRPLRCPSIRFYSILYSLAVDGSYTD